MAEANHEGALERARQAASRGDWRAAYALFLEADARAPLSGADLGRLADSAYAAGHVDVTIDAWERAHSEALRAGDRLAAAGAAVKVAVHLLIDTALTAPIRGWSARAERLLEGEAEGPVHAWLAVVKNYERLLSGDFDGARQWARRAIELGTRHEPAAAAIGRVAVARAMILAGQVPDGLALLNEAAVDTITGDIDPLTTGMIFCEIVCGAHALAQYDLAEEWTEAYERWCPGQALGSIHGRCRVHRAEVLRLRGSCEEAEKEALLACEELRPYLRREYGWPLTELGLIRLRRGDLDGAEAAFVAAHEAGWDPQPGLALVQLARGELEAAASAIREALEHPLDVPSKEWPPNTDLRRAPLLGAQVEIEIAVGDLARAREAAAELSRVARVFQSRALAAAAALANGRVALAEGEASTARRELDSAVRAWSDIRAPYETAVARLVLADALRLAGNEPAAQLELRAARSTLERIGAAARLALDAKTTEHPPPASAKPARAVGKAENVFRREGDYWCVGFEGRTARLRDSKGLHYIAHLLAEPGKELHVVDLVAIESGDAEQVGRAMRSELDLGAPLDAKAKQAYRRRLAEIDEDLEQARAMGDSFRASQASAERELIARELARAVGLGGRERRQGSASERARAAVTRAVRQAMARIREHDPALGEHLERTIRTGTYCAYDPDPRAPVVWGL